VRTFDLTAGEPARRTYQKMLENRPEAKLPHERGGKAVAKFEHPATLVCHVAALKWSDRGGAVATPQCPLGQRRSAEAF
jgi:hypothetical protein